MSAVLVLGAGAALSYRLGVERWEVNLLKQRVEQSTLAILRGEVPQGRQAAARNLRSVLDALERFPGDADLHLEAGASYRVLGDLEAAQRTYEEALRDARRPEIYINLAKVQLARGDLAGAETSLAAVYRHNRVWLDETEAAMAERALARGR